MWEILNPINKKQDDSPKTVKDIHKVFLYHMINQISAAKGSYISRRLSKNYGLISVKSSSVFRTLLVVFAVLCLAVGEAIRRFEEFIPELLDLTEQQCLLIEYVAYLAGIIAVGVVLWKSDFVFSSVKSEGKREADENVIIDYYAQEVLYRKLFKHYVFVIEDLDRTDNPEIVTEFLKELRKYYLSDQNFWKWLHHNKVTFVVCIKPEALLRKSINNDIGGNEKTSKNPFLYHKFFDYILNLPEISIDNYDAILNGLLKELNDELVCLGLISENQEASISNIKGMQWLIRGRALDIRIIKTRLNHVLTLYENLNSKFSEKGISFEKCAAIVYLMTEYENDFYALRASMIEKLLSLYAQNKLEDETEVLNIIGDTFCENFRQEMVSLVESKLVDANYRIYFYNYPKDSNLYSL